jgi:hypothetical protein
MPRWKLAGYFGTVWLLAAEASPALQTRKILFF